MPPATDDPGPPVRTTEAGAGAVDARVAASGGQLSSRSRVRYRGLWGTALEVDVLDSDGVAPWDFR